MSHTDEFAMPMNILFLHGWQSSPAASSRPTSSNHGHNVLNPALPDDDFDAAVPTAQPSSTRPSPDVVVGSRAGPWQ